MEVPHRRLQLGISKPLQHIMPSVTSVLTLLVGRQEGHPACKKTERWAASVVICLQQGADLNMAQLMPLPLTVSCFSKIQIGFTFLVPAHLGSPRQRAVKWVWVCVQHIIFLPQVKLTVTFSLSVATAEMGLFSATKLIQIINK